jgi:acylpyruvate hydrolase
MHNANVPGSDGLTLCAFQSADGLRRAGIKHGGRIVDLKWALSAARAEPAGESAAGLEAWGQSPYMLEDLLAVENWEQFVAAAASGLENVAIPAGYAFGEHEIRLLPPVSRPEKILALALNYISHAREADRPATEFPSLFGKFANSLRGAFDDVQIPAASHRIDYEGELAVVIGRAAHRITPEQAGDVIAGYTVANDVSARDYQIRTPQIMQGKIFDGFCPLGPYLRRLPASADIGELRLRTTVNGDIRQDAKLSEMIFDVPFTVSYISQIVTLRPGDVILTGTPGGIGGAMSPRRWLRNGDVAEVTIEGIGRIANRFVSRGEA